jgi:BirA family biotin operon repressor/biotin-[acetyl-CoA-carboxylase] ligase
MVGEDSGRQQVIMGIGLNVDMPMGEGDVISRPWTDLRTVIGAPIDRNKLAGRLLSQLAGGLTQVDRYGMGDWLQRWRRWDYLKGRSVVVDGVPPVTGIAAGIDDGGALLVDTASGQSVVAGGEASLLQIGGAP